jgi:hypothetical protein
VIPRVCPGSLEAIVQHQDRLVGIDEDGTTLWWSGQLVYGERPWFADLYRYPLTSIGRLVALVSFDTALVVLSETGIAIVEGDGPLDNGAGANWRTRLIPSDVGCSEARSIAVTSQGVFFQSPQGMYLLTRAGQVMYVGRAVADTLAAFPVVCGAVVHVERGQVLWLCASADGTEGAWLVLDYIENVWTTRRVRDPDIGAASAPGVSLVLTANGLAWLTQFGRTYVENAANALDVTSWVPMVVETPELKVAGLQGWQRVWKCLLKFEDVSPHDLKVSFAFDGAEWTETSIQVERVSAKELASLDRGELEFVLVQQDCQSVRVKIEDETPTFGAVGTGRGPALIGIAFEVGVKSGSARRAANTRR